MIRETIPWETLATEKKQKWEKRLGKIVKILLNTNLVFKAAARRALAVIMSKCLSICLSFYMSFYLSVMSHFLGLWLVKNIIVIEVEVDELHEGKILSRPSTSMTISAVAQENKKIKESLSWAVPHFPLFNFTNPPKNYLTPKIYIQRLYVSLCAILWWENISCDNIALFG